MDFNNHQCLHMHGSCYLMTLFKGRDGAVFSIIWMDDESGPSEFSMAEFFSSLHNFMLWRHK